MVWASRRRSSRGVTLIELIVVVAIIGIAAAMVGPELTAAVDRYRQQDPAERLTQVLKVARWEAVRMGSSMCVAVNTTDGNFRVVRAAGSPDSAVVEGVIDGWIGGAGPASPVCFHPSGTASPGRWVARGVGDSVLVKVDVWDGKISIIR